MGIPCRLPVAADVDGDLVVLRASVCPVELIGHLAGGRWWEIFRLMDRDLTLWQRMSDADDPFGVVAAAKVVHQVVAAATGYTWYTACQLAGAIVADFNGFDGIAAYRGFDPWSAPVSRSLALAHHLLRSQCDDEGARARLEYNLAGEDDVSESRALAAERRMASQWAAAFNPDGTSKQALTT